MAKKKKELDLSTPEKRLKHWGVVAKELLVDQTIQTARYVKDKEFGHVFCITLSNGTDIYVMADDEGNGPGSLHCTVPGKEGTQYIPQLR